MPKRTLQRVAELIAKDLRKFGYPDVTEQMVKDVYAVYKRNRDSAMADALDGKTQETLPHGVIGMFVKAQLDDAFHVGLQVVEE